MALPASPLTHFGKHLLLRTAVKSWSRKAKLQLFAVCFVCCLGETKLAFDNFSFSSHPLSYFKKIQPCSNSHSYYLLLQLVLWWHSQRRSREVAAVFHQCEWHVPNPHELQSEELPLSLHQRRGRDQALPHQEAGRGRLLHCQQSDFQNTAGEEWVLVEQEVRSRENWKELVVTLSEAFI